MLQRLGKKSVAANFNCAAIKLQPPCGRPLIPWSLVPKPRNREAALLNLELFSGKLDNLRVYKVTKLVVDAVGKYPLTNSNLVGRDTRSAGQRGGFEKILNQRLCGCQVSDLIANAF